MAWFLFFALLLLAALHRTLAHPATLKLNVCGYLVALTGVMVETARLVGSW